MIAHCLISARKCLAAQGILTVPQDCPQPSPQMAGISFDWTLDAGVFRFPDQVGPLRDSTSIAAGHSTFGARRSARLCDGTSLGSLSFSMGGSASGPCFM